MTQQQLRTFAPPAYVAAALFFFVPLTDTLLANMPMHPGSAAWRFGAMGSFTRALMTPLLGGVLAMAVAASLRHRRVLLGLAVVFFLLAAAVLVMTPMFALDAMEVRSMAQPAARSAFVAASVIAGIKFMINAFAYGIAGWGALRLMKQLPKPEPVVKPAGDMLVRKTA